MISACSPSDEPTDSTCVCVGPAMSTQTAASGVARSAGRPLDRRLALGLAQLAIDDGRHTDGPGAVGGAGVG